MWKRSLLLLVILMLVAACDDNMAVQPKCQTLGQIQNFQNGACAQVPPEGVVARDAVVDNSALTTGLVNDHYVTTIPIPLTSAVLERGRERYTIYCAVCHGQAGYGDGILTKYNFPAPLSYHSDALRSQPPGFFFNVISNGSGEMYNYREQITVPDRWAIVAYIRALQLSQHAPAASLPETDRGQLPQ